MEVNDVRVGNWVRGSAQMKIYQVTNVHIADLITIQNDEEELECLSDRVYPIELTDDLLAKISLIGDQLTGYTEKLVFSFVDISAYKKVEANLRKNNINYREWTPELMEEFAQKLSILNKRWGYELATCGEKIDIEKYGIKHNKCVDDELMIKLASHDSELMKHLGVEIHECGMFDDMPSGVIDLGDRRFAVRKKSLKDKGQRAFCGCIASKDIGEYNTCAHQCEYCYANASKEIAIANLKRHKLNPHSETIGKALCA